MQNRPGAHAMNKGNVPPDWGAIQRNLKSRARSKGFDRDASHDLAATAIEKALKKGGQEALARKILDDDIAESHRVQIRRRGLALGGNDPSDVEIPGRNKGGAPRKCDFETFQEALAVALKQASSEFEATWGVPAVKALPGALADMADQPKRNRRSWLVRALDEELGDYCPWAVDQGFRTRGAKRKRAARGVPDGPPQPPPRDHAQRLWEAWLSLKAKPTFFERFTARACDVGVDVAKAEVTAYLYQKVGWPTGPVEVSPLENRDQYLTDREIATISLLLGNKPESLASKEAPIKDGSVLTAEIEAVQGQRNRHGKLRTAEQKRAAFVGPKPRRRP